MIKSVVGVMAIVVWAGACLAADPAVTNVRAYQREGTQLVDITYDLTDTDTATLAVTVSVSTNSGAVYFTPSSSLSGDLGNVSRGTGKKIIWNAGAVLPPKLYHNVRARVSASDEFDEFPFLDGDNFTAKGWSISGNGDNGWRIKWDQYLQPPNSATKSITIPWAHIQSPIILSYQYGVSNNRLQVFVNDNLVASYENHDNLKDNGDMPFIPASHDVSNYIPNTGKVTIRFVNDDIYPFDNHTKLDKIGLSH